MGEREMRVGDFGSWVIIFAFKYLLLSFQSLLPNFLWPYILCHLIWFLMSSKFIYAFSSSSPPFPSSSWLVPLLFFTDSFPLLLKWGGKLIILALCLSISLFPPLIYYAIAIDEERNLRRNIESLKWLNMMSGCQPFNFSPPGYFLSVAFLSPCEHLSISSSVTHPRFLTGFLCCVTT